MFIFSYVSYIFETKVTPKDLEDMTMNFRAQFPELFDCDAPELLCRPMSQEVTLFSLKAPGHNHAGWGHYEFFGLLLNY